MGVVMYYVECGRPYRLTNSFITMDAAWRFAVQFSGAEIVAFKGKSMDLKLMARVAEIR